MRHNVNIWRGREYTGILCHFMSVFVYETYVQLYFIHNLFFIAQI